MWRRHTDGVEDAWTGRACKVYSRTAAGWKLIMHTGALVYPES